MSKYPRAGDKVHKTPVATPSDFVEYLTNNGRLTGFRAIEGIILTYQSDLFSYAEKAYKLYTPPWGVGGLKIIGGESGTVGILGRFGIGAPAAAVLLEEYIALGTRRFLSIGSAGALSPDLDIGDAVVCDRAIRDEGTSWHYRQGSEIAYPSPPMTAALSSMLKERGIPYRCGGTWTVDAPFMESREEVEEYAQEGILTVEMEASALFTIAEVRGVEVGSAFAVSDNLHGGKWNPRFHDVRVKRRLRDLLDVSVEILGSE